MTLVIDSSLLIAALFEEEHTEFALSVIEARDQDDLVAPVLLKWEIANVLWVKHRRGVQTAEQARARARGVRALRIRYIDPENALLIAFETAAATGLTAYDAAYLRLAQDLGAPLATLDEPMSRASAAAGITVLSPYS